MTVQDLLPRVFSQANTYRVVHLQPDQARGAFEMIEETLAEALRDVRHALAMEVQPVDAGLALEPHARRLREVVLRRRRLLSDDARHLLGAYLDEAEVWATRHGSSAELESVITALSRALEASEWVADLLGAERDIGWHRGIGDDARLGR